MATSIIGRLKLHKLIEDCNDLQSLKALSRYLIEREAFIVTNFGDLLDLNKKSF